MAVLRIVFLIFFLWFKFCFGQQNDSIFYKNQFGLSISKIFRSTVRDKPLKLEAAYKRFIDNKNYFQLSSGYENDKVGFYNNTTTLTTYKGGFLRLGKFKSFSPKLFKKKRYNLFNVGINLFGNYYNQYSKIKPDGYYVNSVYIYKNLSDYNIGTELEFTIKLMQSANKRISLETTQRIGYLIKRPLLYYYVDYLPGYSYYNHGRITLSGLNLMLYFRFN